MQSHEIKIDVSIPLAPLDEAILKRDIKSIEKQLENNEINMDIDLVNDALNMLRERLPYNEQDSVMRSEAKIIFDIFNRPMIQCLFAANEIKKNNIQDAVEIVLKIDKLLPKDKHGISNLLGYVNYLLPFCPTKAAKNQFIIDVADQSILLYNAIKNHDVAILKILLDNDNRFILPVINVIAGNDYGECKTLSWILNQYVNDISSPLSLDIRDKVIKSAIKGGNSVKLEIIYNHFRSAFTPEEEHMLRISTVPDIKHFYLSNLLTKYIAYESGKLNNSCVFFRKYTPVDKINAASALLNAKKLRINDMKKAHPVFNVSNKLGELLRVVTSCQNRRSSP